ncbi:MAG: PTS lactose/cellobiose transporter subunit IIA [Liquorilactobacillus nagelii]|uniref:PTS lactose/cellobiose transporter subunit IIA n=1 Tax=Liquorilactobacillus nagelii TaxID=82688 RepID=UPI0039E86168
MEDIEKKQQIAMQIILNAGDARNFAMQALDQVAERDFVQAESLLKQAKEKITLAHNAQTDEIQAEAAGETAIYSLLFNHAQDTLMTVISEINLTEKMIKIVSSLVSKN